MNNPSNTSLGFVKPDTNQQIFFYEQDFYILSNFSAFRIHFPIGDGQTKWFHTSEECYHWLKFNHLIGYGVQKLLEEATSAHDAFQLAQVHKTLQRPDWDEVKVYVMRAILQKKVEQHPYVFRKLIATGERELIEDSWRDDFWGWGPNRNGQNMLGKLWMDIRADLKK